MRSTVTKLNEEEKPLVNNRPATDIEIDKKLDKMLEDGEAFKLHYSGGVGHNGAKFAPGIYIYGTTIQTINGRITVDKALGSTLMSIDKNAVEKEKRIEEGGGTKITVNESGYIERVETY